MKESNFTYLSNTENRFEILKLEKILSSNKKSVAAKNENKYERKEIAGFD